MNYLDATSDQNLGLLDTILASAPVGLAFVDCDFRFVRINETLAHLNGLPVDAHLGRPAHEVNPTWAPVWESYWRQVVDSGHPITDLELGGIVRGEMRYSLVNYYPVRTAQNLIIGVGIVVLDITERKRAEEQQQFLADAGRVLASSLDYTITLENVVQLVVPRHADWCAVFTLDDAGAVKTVAAAYAKPEDSLVLEALRKRCTLGTARRFGITEVLWNGEAVLYSELPPELIDELTLQHPALYADLKRLHSYLCVPLVARGALIGAITFAITHSQRRYMAADLRMASELARSCSLAVENTRLYSEANEAIRVRNEMLSVVSHDLRNPLGIIKGFAQQLQRKVLRPNLDPATIVGTLEKIDAAATRMNQMINDLIDVTRLQTGERMVLERQQVDLARLIQDVISELHLEPNRHPIRLEQSKEAVIGYWDAIRIERVLSNLLSNAIKYSPNGGEIMVRFGLEHLGSQAFARIDVQDGGIGIPAADLPTIFERFRRGSNAIGQFGGSGVGLASARQIVELHGGTISVHSVEGQGSTFSVWLPLG